MKKREEVIARLYELHYRSLLKLANLLVGPSSAEDLVQDAFVRALDHWKPGSSEDAFRAWAQTTMVRLSISRWRRANRERAAYQRHGAPAEIGQAEIVPELERALASLTPRQRAAVILRYFEDLSEAAIAERMGVRPGTVKALLSQGRERLRLERSLIAS